MSNDQRRDLTAALSGEVLQSQGGLDSIAANLTRAEIDQQIATARRYPRSVTAVMRQIETLATLDEETAAECIYQLPRDGKKIIGPSVRFAEIVAQSWGNCRVAARITNEGKTHLEATGVYHDLETNMAIARSVPVRITKSNGQRYGDDMVGTASAAGTSKALRNAILAGVPKGVWRSAFAKVQEVARGTAATLTTRRREALTAFKALGVDSAAVFEVLGVKGEADISLDLMLDLRGVYTALNTGETTIGAMLAEVRAEKAGPKADVGAKLAGGGKGPGFSTEHVENETGNGKKAAAEETPHDPLTGEVLEGEVTQAEPKPASRRKAAAPKETAAEVKARQDEETAARLRAREAAEDAGREDALAGTSRDITAMTEEETRYYENGYATGKAQREALDKAAGEAKEAAPADPEPVTGAEPQEDEEEVTPGHAAPGEVYMHADDDWGDDDKTPTYKDGSPFSRVGEKGAAELKVYAEHSPAAAAESPSPEKETAPEGSDPAAADEDGEFGPVELALQDMSGATSWLAIKAKLPGLYKLPEFEAAAPEVQRDIRATVWDMVLAVKEAHKDPVDHAADVSAFRLWMETQEGKDGADAIEGTFRTLKREPTYERLSDAQKDSVEAGVISACMRLRAA